MSAPFPYDVFLSHSAKDKPVVRDVAERLRKDGLRVWFDEWEIRPGDSIERTQSKTAKIEEGLERSRVLVLCMSANAFGSDWAQLESGTFRFRDPLNKERRFLPLHMDDAPIKSSLEHFQKPVAAIACYALCIGQFLWLHFNLKCSSAVPLHQLAT